MMKGVIVLLFAADDTHPSTTYVGFCVLHIWQISPQSRLRLAHCQQRRHFLNHVHLLHRLGQATARGRQLYLRSNFYASELFRMP